MSQPTYLNILMVEEFKTANGTPARTWTKIGAAFPHSDGRGYNLELKAFPRDGRLVMLPPAGEEHENSTTPASGGKPTAGTGRAR